MWLCVCVCGGGYIPEGVKVIVRDCVDVCVGGCMDVAVDVTGQDENRDNSSPAD